MTKIVKSTLIVLVVSLMVCGQAKSPNDSPLQRLQFLMGEWTAFGDTQLGRGQGAFSFRPELNGQIMVRRSFAEYKTGKAAGTRHDDLMVIYVEPPATGLQAMYFDSEGHVIHYAVSLRGEKNQAVFESDESQAGPKYRLSYSLDRAVLSGRFEVAPPGQGFKTYLEWKSQRSSEKSQ